MFCTLLAVGLLPAFLLQLRFWPESDEEHGRLGRRLDDCLAQHGARWLRSYLSADHRRLVCEFEAPDAEAVRVSYRSAGVWLVGPDFGP